MGKKTILNFILLLSPLFSFGQWNQHGTAIQGETEGDYFGYSTSMNAEGNVVVVGGYGNDENGDFAGHVRVFEWNGMDWIQRGTDIDGSGQDQWSGHRVTIDASGNTIAITSIVAENALGLLSGKVQVFEWDGVDWVQRGNDIEGEGDPIVLEWFGAGISFSANGNILAIGGPGNLGAGFKAGYTRIFQWDGNEWVQLGNNILGDEAHDEFGFSINLNGSGNIVAIGALGNLGFGNNQEGYVKVFEWDGTNWTPLGSKIKGVLNGDEFGRSLSLNNSGDVLAIGAPGYDLGSNDLTCTAYVYEWDGTNWIQRGNTLIGAEDTNGFGEAISLNSNGNILAVGAPAYLTNGNVQIFEWINNNWVQQGSNIIGEELNDIFGSSLRLNASGNTIAIGGWGNQDIGHVRVFKNESIVGVNPTLVNAELIQAYPNPTDDILEIKEVNQLINLSLVDLNGRALFTKRIDHDSSIDLTNLPAGVYILKIQTSKAIQSEMIIKH